MARILTFSFITIFLIFAICVNSTASKARPNIVIFIVDDLGYGDVGCFGNKTITTPNIDALAKDGIKLTHATAAAALCTPSRSAILTGRYPARTGMASHILGVIPFVAVKAGLPAEETTFARALQESGYRTALIGKWHQGLHCDWFGDKCHHPHTHGFQYFYGIPLTNMHEFDGGKPSFALVFPNGTTYFMSAIFLGLISTIFAWRYGHSYLAVVFFALGVAVPVYIVATVWSSKFLNSMLMRDDQVIEQPLVLDTLTKRFVRESEKFLKKQEERSGSPFLLLMTFNHVHVALRVQEKFKNSGPHGSYGDAIRETDWAIGQIVSTIKKLNLHNNTIFLFTSDQGAHVESSKDGGSNFPFSGGKGMHSMEGGIRVPTIISWSGQFASNIQLHAPVSHMDIFPTLLHLANVQMPKDHQVDGRDLTPLLRGQVTISPHRFLFHYSRSDSIDAVRYVENDKAVWKVHYKLSQWLPGTRRCHYVCSVRTKELEDPIVYNVIEDPAEEHPLDPSNPKYKEITSLVQVAISEHKSTLQAKPAQLSLTNVLWRPWLQPCCNFPFCSCREEEESDTADF